MRKLTILLALAATAASSGCCNCGIGRCRNWFSKGSPCGTTVAPAVLGAPLAMGTPLATPVSVPYMQPQYAQPMMSAPVCVDQAPMCPPCPDQCYDPCASGAMTMGYMGGYTSEAPCCDGSSGMPATMQPGTTYTVPQGATISPSPQPE